MKHAHSGPRRAASSLATLALVAGATAVLATPAPAQAATTTITNAELRWELNKESTSGAYAPGTWNLFSAGRLGNPGSGGQTLTSADEGATWVNGAAAGWRNTDGNVTVLDRAADGSYAPTTWLGARQSASGVNANTSGVSSENLLSLRNGTGTVDPVSDTGTISWDGDFTVVYYSGMSFFYVSDPRLTVENGTGKVTATLGGYGSDMDDPSQWNALPATEVTLADVSGVDLTATGLRTTPSYLGVAVAPPAGNPAQSTGSASWGSFPQSFIDFQGAVGTASYWYSSGGGADVRKPTTPIEVSWSEPGQASVRVSRTTLLPNGAQQVTVEGTGFDPANATGARPPLAGRPAGAYVAFGRYADVWRPSAGAPSTARVNAGGAGLKWAVSSADMATVGGAAAGAIELRADGTFTATLTVDKSVVDAKASTGSYGIYTYPGAGAVQPLYETFTPITFAKAVPSLSVSATGATYGADVPVTVTLTGDAAASGDITLRDGATTVGTATLVGGSASFTLVRPAVGAHDLVATYDGDANHEAASGTTRLTITPAPTPTPTPTPVPGTADEPVRGTAKVTWGTKPTAGRKGTAVVRVSDLATGRVTAVLRTAAGARTGAKAGKRISTITARIKDGAVKLRLPRLARGRYSLVVTVPGNDDVAKVKVTRTFRVA